MIDYKLKTFPNGLRLITAPLTNTKAVTVLFLVGTGSRYEKKSINGIAHFLEHMFFKGTKKRPNTLDIAKTLDGVGASYNAFTSEEHTGFYVRVPSEHFDLALDVLFDMLYSSLFSPEEIEREKGVILEEINMYQDNPQAYIGEVAKKLFYADQPLGRQVTGEKETVRTFNQETFIQFRNQFYTPDNMIVAVAGSPNGAHWEEKIQEFFAKVQSEKTQQFQSVKESQQKPAILTHYKKTDQTHLFLGFRSLPRTDKRRYVLKVLNNLFGENMSSRLFTEVRERRGLAYYVSSEMIDFQDSGIFGAVAGVDISRVGQAIKVILEEFKKLKEKEVPPEELQRAKENLKGKLYLGLEESFSVAEFLAEQELFWQKVETPEELVAKYEKVTAKDILSLANEIFTAKNLNLAMIGPFKEKEKFINLLEEF